MSWKEQSKAAQLALQSREAQKSYGYGSYGYSGGYTNQAQNPLIKVLGDKLEARDPRVKLPSYRALEHALTIVQLAISVHERFIGVPEIVKGEKGNPKAVKVLQDFWANTPIYGQLINPLAADKGLEAFVPQMIQ